MWEKYLIELRDEDVVEERREAAFPSVRAAIDHVGQIRYAGEIVVWRGRELIARLPAIRMGLH